MGLPCWMAQLWKLIYFNGTKRNHLRFLFLLLYWKQSDSEGFSKSQPGCKHLFASLMFLSRVEKACHSGGWMAMFNTRFAPEFLNSGFVPEFFKWRIIALQNFVFCQTSTWISQNVVNPGVVLTRCWEQRERTISLVGVLADDVERTPLLSSRRTLRG